MLDPAVESAIRSLKAENSDIPESFWHNLVGELSDSRLYYVCGTYVSPDFNAAFSIGKDHVRAWRKKDQKRKCHENTKHA